MNNIITIKPIFNQAEPMVWENFAEIEMSARAEYGHMFMDGAFNNLWLTHHDDWQQLPENIAFGAYNGDTMIGFVKGFLVESHEFKLDSLFVDPGYRGLGVGKNLVNSFENAVSLKGSYIQGVAYDGARGFYKKQKYSVIGGKNDNPKFTKKLLFPTGVVPVFDKWRTSAFRIKLAKVPVDTALLKKSRHQPMFVHADNQHQIDVVGLRTRDGENLVWLSPNIPQEYRTCRENSVRIQLNNIR